MPQQICLFFWAYFIGIAKRNNFVEDFFSIRALFRREIQFKNSKITVVPVFWEEKTGTYSVVVKKLSFQIEFYRRKRACFLMRVTICQNFFSEYDLFEQKIEL
jgi:hypothetical protein